MTPPGRDWNEATLGSVKHIVFGATQARLTRQRCEEFFDDPKNFVP